MFPTYTSFMTKDQYHFEFTDFLPTPSSRLDTTILQLESILHNLTINH